MADAGKLATKRTVLHLSKQLVAAIDAARGDTPRSGWVEAQLWKLAAVKKGATAAFVVDPKRLADKRGKWQRPDAGD